MQKGRAWIAHCRICAQPFTLGTDPRSRPLEERIRVHFEQSHFRVT